MIRDDEFLKKAQLVSQSLQNSIDCLKETSDNLNSFLGYLWRFNGSGDVAIKKITEYSRSECDRLIKILTCTLKYSDASIKFYYQATEFDDLNDPVKPI